LLSKKPPVDFESYRAPSLKTKDVDNSKNKKKEDLLAIDIERDVIGKKGKSGSRKNKKRKVKEAHDAEFDNGSSSQNVGTRSRRYSSQPTQKPRKRPKNKHTNEEGSSSPDKDENTDPKNNHTPRSNLKQHSFSQPNKTEPLIIKQV